MYKLRRFFIYLLVLFVIMACDSGMLADGSTEKTNETDGGVDLGSEETSDSDDIVDQGDGNFDSGVITAGEWSDLEHWDFWLNLFGQNYGYENMPGYWNFYTNNRISVLVENSGEPVVDVLVELKRNGSAVWTTRTNNRGKAELWIGLFQEENVLDTSLLSIWVDGTEVNQEVSLYSEGVNTVEWSNSVTNEMVVDIAFVVDATGSMGDELEFLKEDLQSVIQTVISGNQNTSFYSGSVFYRDEGETYLTRSSDFSSDYYDTINFIEQQSASGGGDIPEAVHSALTAALDLSWHSSAQARLLFLLLDAPPHYEVDVITSIQTSINEAAERGITIIPITASGIDKETEFLMRFFSVTTNGTYVFITDHSGVGNDHLEATVGSYQVELLNELLVRLIQEYSE